MALLHHGGSHVHIFAMSHMRIVHYLSLYILLYRVQMEQEQVLNKDRGRPMSSWVFEN